MNESLNNCPICDNPVSPDLIGGLCPKCLLRQDLVAEDTNAAEEPTLAPNAPDSSPDDATLAPQQTDLVATSNAQVSDSKRFGDYELIDEIARGGMGVVYRARDLQLNRQVALKMILSGQLAGEQDIVRFKQEAEAAANLDHSGIVPIYEIGEVDGQHFFSMKLIEGGSLIDHLQELRGDIRRFVTLVEKVARGVHYAHQRGILHRDLKPGNILLTEDGDPVITDLGLAKQLQSDSNLTHTGAVVGTPAYMPPEQAAAKKEITTAADIYSIGAILYEALTGRTPHRADSPIETLMQALEGNIVPPREIDGNVDRTLELICMKCLERDPNNRYSSAAALAEDLRNWLNGQPVSVRPRSLAATVGDVFLSNLRGAFGAAIVGMFAGILFAFCLSRGYSDHSVHENPPSKIYRQLPTNTGEMPAGRNLVFLTEQQLSRQKQFAFCLAAAVVVMSVGWCIRFVTKAKYGGESMALGLIGSLLMAVMAVYFILGLAKIDDIREKMILLGDVAFGSATEQETAFESLAQTYPEVSELAPTLRSKTIAYRVYYDHLYAYPLHMLQAILSSILLCVCPALSCTCLAAKIHEQKRSATRGFLIYTEFAGLLVIAIMSFWLAVFLPGLSGQRPNVILLMIYAATSVWLVALYQQRISWRWRLGVYGTLASLISIPLIVALINLVNR